MFLLSALPTNANASKLGKGVEITAAHSKGNNWVPGKSDVAKVVEVEPQKRSLGISTGDREGGKNMIWLYEGEPYRLSGNDNVFIAMNKSTPVVNTQQTNAVGIEAIPLAQATKIFERNPITKGVDKIIFTPKGTKQTRVVQEGTYPLYFGPKHSIPEVVNPDGTVNPLRALTIEREVADNIPEAFRMEKRLENP